MDIAERFWSKVDKTAGCWMWRAARIRGYGAFRVAGKQVRAHRWAYEHEIGPIPAGLTLDHLCHSSDLACRGGEACLHRACVRPDHLEPVTLRTNTLRSPVAAPAVNARKTHCRDGHPLIDGGAYRKCRECYRRRDREAKLQKRREAGVPAGRGARERAKTHCPKGHPYDAENARRNNAGSRICRACERARGQARRVTQASRGSSPA